MTDHTPYLIALLRARAEGDTDTLAELRDVLADDEHADALLEEADGGGVDSEPPADTSDA